MKHHQLLPLILIMMGGATGRADDSPTPGQLDASQKTQALLRNAADRNKAIANSPEAKDADSKAGALAGSAANKEEMYDISASVFDKLAKEGNYDDKKMQEIAAEAQKNPQAFYDKYFSDEDKAKVKGLAGKIESQKVPVNGMGQ